MIDPTRRAVLLGLGVATLAGCSSPATAFYTLAAMPGTRLPGGPKMVELRRPGLAGYLDRTAIVRQGAGYRLDVASTEGWGEPLGTMLARVLAEDLTQRLPASNVFTESGGITTDADAFVEIDVQRFDADPGAGSEPAVTLLAQVAIQRGVGRTPAGARTIRLTAQPAGGSTAALVATMSALLGQLADQVAEMLQGG